MPCSQNLGKAEKQGAGYISHKRLSNVLGCNKKNTLSSFFDCSDGLEKEWTPELTPILCSKAFLGDPEPCLSHAFYGRNSLVICRAPPSPSPVLLITTEELKLLQEKLGMNLHAFIHLRMSSGNSLSLLLGRLIAMFFFFLSGRREGKATQEIGNN